MGFHETAAPKRAFKSLSPVPMRTIQHPSKLILLNNQHLSRPSPWPKLLLVAVLAAVNVWNIGVIRDRYATSANEKAPAQEQLPEQIDETEKQALSTFEAKEPIRGVIAPSRALAASMPATVTADPEAERQDGPVDEQAVASQSDEPVPIADPKAVEPKETVATETRTKPATKPEVSSSGKETPLLLSKVEPGNGRAVANRVVARTIKPGQAVATAAMEAGLTGEQAHQVVSALAPIFDFTRARPGEGFRIKLDPDGDLELFDYERSPVESYVVRRKNGSLVGYKRDLAVEREIIKIEGEIRSSLFGAVETAGADASLAVLLANVLAWDVDFYRDPRRGDQFRVIVERFHHRGRHLNYGDILAAEYQGEVGNVRLFRHERDDGEVGYYDEKGRSAQRAFLRAPLQVVRVTSGYGNRRHPILGYSRKHRGVDYGAPTGTPVWAVGDGTVITAGRQGAYGNLIVLRHANGYTTWYAHLSRMHVRVGQRVRQQDVIGRVGATGMATGPHLHYEIRHHGRHINPLTLKLPPREPLPDSAMPAYHAAIEPVRALLDGVELVAQAPGAIPPP